MFFKKKVNKLLIESIIFFINTDQDLDGDGFRIAFVDNVVKLYVTDKITVNQIMEIFGSIVKELDMIVNDTWYISRKDSKITRLDAKTDEVN